MLQQELFGELPTPVTSSRREEKPVPRPQHTWFFALRPAAADARRIHASVESLLASNGVTGKRIDTERLHITLALVGHDVDAGAMEMACRAADTVCFSAVEARFDAAMTFSAPSGPLVLLGSEGLDQVRELRTVLCCAMADRGFASSRVYEPHMTLCYDPRRRLARTPIEPIGFRAAEFSLIKSYIGFSRHEVVRAWCLSGSGAAPSYDSAPLG